MGIRWATDRQTDHYRQRADIVLELYSCNFWFVRTRYPSYINAKKIIRSIFFSLIFISQDEKLAYLIAEIIDENWKRMSSCKEKWYLVILNSMNELLPFFPKLGALLHSQQYGKTCRVSRTKKTRGGEGGWGGACNGHSSGKKHVRTRWIHDIIFSIFNFKFLTLIFNLISTNCSIGCCVKKYTYLFVYFMLMWTFCWCSIDHNQKVCWIRCDWSCLVCIFTLIYFI